MASENKLFGLCRTGTEFYDLTKTSFELLRGYILQKYGSRSLAQLFETIPDFNHRVLLNFQVLHTKQKKTLAFMP